MAFDLNLDRKSARQFRETANSSGMEAGVI